MRERRKATVLVVEDDESLLFLFGRVLTQAGFIPSTIATLQEAQSAFSRQSFDLLICDLSVPGGKNVFNFIAAARAQNPTMAVLIITGFAPHEIASHAEITGIPVLEKPFSPIDLIGRISLLLDCQAA
ncbi:MAG TPA: response regulator [Terriglobales bacterium]|nr:response regulator [Terriglobales bacterium]